MCVYCNMGDTWFRYDPPFAVPVTIPNWHLIPKPLVPVNPWPVEKLKEYLDILKQVHEMEQKIGCPCEPNKADYIKILQDRIDALRAAAGGGDK